MYLKVYCVIALAVLGILSATDAVTVDAVLDSMEANEEPPAARTEITQIVYTPSGRENRSELISFSIDTGQKSLMEYTAPARIEGMKILMHNEGDDIWFYSPRTSRVRKIASHQKNQSVAGSDFSYEDMSSRDMRKDYNAVLKGEQSRAGVPCYYLEMTAKSDDKTYSKALLWVDKEKYVTVEAHFFDEDGRLWKKLTVDDIEQINGYWTPRTIEMKNVLKGSRTVMRMKKIDYDVTLDQEMFSQRALRR